MPPHPGCALESRLSLAEGLEAGGAGVFVAVLLTPQVVQGAEGFSVRAARLPCCLFVCEAAAPEGKAAGELGAGRSQRPSRQGQEHRCAKASPSLTLLGTVTEDFQPFPALVLGPRGFCNGSVLPGTGLVASRP